MLGTVTYYFVRPIGGTIALGDRRGSWTMPEVTFKLLDGNQKQPSDNLVFNLHRALRDAEGAEIPVEVLSLLDLENGMRDAFTAATTHIFTPSPAV